MDFATPDHRMIFINIIARWQTYKYEAVGWLLKVAGDILNLPAFCGRRVFWLRRSFTVDGKLRAHSFR